MSLLQNGFAPSASSSLLAGDVLPFDRELGHVRVCTARMQSLRTGRSVFLGTTGMLAAQEEFWLKILTSTVPHSSRPRSGRWWCWVGSLLSRPRDQGASPREEHVRLKRDSYHGPADSAGKTRPVLDARFSNGLTSWVCVQRLSLPCRERSMRGFPLSWGPLPDQVGKLRGWGGTTGGGLSCEAASTAAPSSTLSPAAPPSRWGPDRFISCRSCQVWRAGGFTASRLDQALVLAHLVSGHRRNVSIRWV